jgi:cytochrome c biogenesis protein CcmG/thiol:disulfide interchange protein DsbE
VPPAYNQTNKTYRTALTNDWTAPRAGRRGHRQVNTTAWMAAALLVVAPFAGFAAGTSSATSPTPQSATDFSLPSLANRDQSIRLADYRGKTVYLDFWSSWCLPCRESLPLLSRLQADFADNDFAVVTISLDSLPRDARALMQELGLNYPVASDIGWTVARQYGLQSLPAAFLITADGKIRLELPRLDQHSYPKIALAVKSAINDRLDKSAGGEPVILSAAD